MTEKPATTESRWSRSPTASSPVEVYLRDINATPLLTAKQEQEVAYRIMEGDAEARDLMVRANLRLVVKIARQYTSPVLALQDLIGEGNLGLMRAVERFDPTRNIRFSTYASYWIKQSIRRALIQTSITVHIPAYMVQLLAKWRQALARLQDGLGRPPQPDEVLKSLKLPPKRLRLIKKALQVSTLSPLVNQGEDGWTLDEVLVDDRLPRSDSRMIDAEDLKLVRELLNKMDAREATVLRLRFGLGDREPMTLKMIGKHLSLTRERVRQIQNDALRKLGEQLLSGSPGRLKALAPAPEV